MPQFNVLVSGAGIAGSVVAYWLGRAGVNVTVVEQATELRTSGQGVDIRGKGIDIIRKMGVEDEIRKHTTKEQGLMFVDDDNNALATFDISGDRGDQGFTAEIEIIRSDLARILYNASLSIEQVNYEFDTTIVSLNQDASSVTAELSNGQSRRYDMVIASDGFGSKTRDLVIGREKSKAAIFELNLFVAYFTIPAAPQDSPRSRWYPTTNRRALNLRPKSPGKTSAYLTIITKDPAFRSAQSSGDILRQKAIMSEAFADVHRWEIPRVLKAMQDAGRDDFYFQEVGQIRLDASEWHSGRTAFVGDTAYCPSPLTGMGTTLAIIGAYVLAGEIVAQIKNSNSQDTVTSSSLSANPPSDPAMIDAEAAFTNYERLLGDYVRTVQKLPLGGAVVNLVNPETSWGLWFLRTVLWLVDRSGIAKLAGLVGEGKTEGVDIPDYQF